MINSAEKRMRAMYGVNREIKGPYDIEKAVRCENGTFVGKEKEDVLSFKGIPYAKPPVGERRWKRPEQAEKNDGIYEAFYFGASPIQTKWPSEVGSYYPQSEDCLTLNIWAAKKDLKDRAVMVFFHGGSYGWGAVSDPLYDGHNFVKRFEDIILVTVEYRVGIMGFIDLSMVEGGEDFPESGNLGLLDQICALKWIRENIRSFGGDPDKVTIFGESAGAGSVSLLPLIDEAKGLFRRVIAESGSIALTYSREECKKLTKRMLKKTGCTCMRELMELPEKELRRFNEQLNDFNNFPERDGVVLPLDLYGAYREGKSNGVDLLIGTNRDEVRYWIREMGYYVPGIEGKTIFRQGLPVVFENNEKRMSAQEKAQAKAFLHTLSGPRFWRLTEFYNEMLFRLPAMEQARLHAENGNRAYTYYWACPGEDKEIGACHAIELSYVFRNLQETIYTGAYVEPELADTVQEMWANFARTGDPSTKEYAWDPYDGDTRKTMVLSKNTHIEEDLKGEQRILLEDLLHHYFNGCYSQLSFWIPRFRKAAAVLLSAAALTICLAVLLNRKR